MLKKPHYLAVGAILLLSILLLKLPQRAASQVKLVFSSMFSPVFGLADSADELVANTAQAIVPRSELTRQISQLQAEVQDLRLRQMQAQAIAQENQRLRQQMGLPAQHPQWRWKLARVVARDPANWWRSLKLDLGSRDGVNVNSPVLSAEGLVGRISEVGFAHSQAVLLGDPDCRVSVIIAETRDHGVIAPASSRPMDASLVEMGYLSHSSQLKAGQTVLTSGLGEVFPKGLLVGQIVDYRQVDYGLYLEARVKLAARLNTLEEVWVNVGKSGVK